MLLSINILQHNLRSIDLLDFHLESCGVFVSVFLSDGDFVSFFRVIWDGIAFSVGLHPSLSVFLRQRSCELLCRPLCDQAGGLDAQLSLH